MSNWFHVLVILNAIKDIPCAITGQLGVRARYGNSPLEGIDSRIWIDYAVPAITANCFVIPVVVYVLRGNIPANLSSFIVRLLIFTIIIFMGIIIAGLNKSEFREIHNYFGGIFS